MKIVNRIIHEGDPRDDIQFDKIIEESILIENCIINRLQISGGYFHHPVIIKNSIFGEINANGRYFHKGLHLSGCIVHKMTSFEAGCYNEPDREFRIENNIFYGLVDFFDCVFNGPVIFSNNICVEGTSLLGNKGSMVEAEYKGGLVYENNIGRLDIET